MESILALEEQIRDCDSEVAITTLKRARNSLLNVSKLPPEILGDIFCWNVTLKDDFGGLEKRSHNFLLVCHHWFEVASSTPEVWSFWGNTPKDWARWCRRSEIAPLDLVLDSRETSDTPFDVTPFDVLKDRAARDTIRRLHLRAYHPEFLDFLICILAPSSGELRHSSVESILLCNEDEGSVDISDFFAYYSFPQLQRLKLYCCTISSWDLLTSWQITTLTDLEIVFCWLEPTPSASQILPILASNPTLRKFSLFCYRLGIDDGGGTSPRVSLHHLKELRLDGEPREVFDLLDRLDVPRHMELLDITLDSCTVEDVSQTIGPYLRQYLRHHDRSQSGLGFSLSSCGYDITFQVGDVGGIDFSVPAPAWMNMFMDIFIEMDQIHPKNRLEEITLGLAAHVPREEVVYFQAQEHSLGMVHISAQLPNLRALHFKKTPLPFALPRATSNSDAELFPSVRCILLDRVVVSDGDGWDPLTAFLLRRECAGRRLHSLVILGPYPTPPSSFTRGLVREFRLNPYATKTDPQLFH